MTPRPGGTEQSEEEIRRRRAVAVGALATAFVLFLLAVVFAFAGSGDGGSEAPSQPVATTPKKKPSPPKPTQPQPTAPGGVPANAPGAHKAPNEAVPVLAYSVINTPKPDTANPGNWVPPAEFGAEMDNLAGQGFHPVTLRQVWAAWKEGGLLPAKPIVISFDTGYHSVYANALPVLRKRQWPGTLFLLPSQTQADFPPEEVKALVQAGWELDAQAESGAGPSALADERRTLQTDFGAKVEFLAYPDGSFDSALAQAAQSAGFLSAVTDEDGVAAPDQPPFELKRLRVHNGDGAQGLADRLTSAGVG